MSYGNNRHYTLSIDGMNIGDLEADSHEQAIKQCDNMYSESQQIRIVHVASGEVVQNGS